MAASEGDVQRDHWYRLELADEPVGWMRRDRVRIDAGADAAASIVRSRHHTWLRVRRAGSTITMETESTFVETPDGAPIAASVRTTNGDAHATVDWRFDGASIRERREEDGRVRASERSRPAGPWLTPAAADLLVAGRIEAGADRIEWATLDPEAGLAVVRITMHAEGRDQVEIDGRTVAATRWRVRSSATPSLETVQLRSRDGHLLRETTETPLGVLTARLTSRTEALAGATGEAAEVLAPALIEPEGRIDRDWRRIRYAIRRTDGVAAAPMPSGGPQVVSPGDAADVQGEPGGAAWWRVTIDPSADVPGDPPVVPADLAATPFIDAADEAVRRLAERAVARAGPSDRARAEALRRAVRAHIDRKDLDRLFDSASRAVRHRRGDCSEHAVLLAAVLRAQDIPARIAYGLVHVEAFAGRERVFAWHMWTRAFVDGRWVDLDATRRRPFGPTHLRVAETAGEDGAVLGRLAALLAAVGQLEIRVLGGDR